jgi:5-carboxyvanillate decarboxylase
MFCREVLGPDRVMYAMDYPYEYSVNEVRWQDDLPLTVAEKKQFYQTNAEDVFGLAVRGTSPPRPPGKE